MCLAVPAKMSERNGDTGWVTVGDARMRVNLLMTPQARPGDWVLVHAGFAIQTISEQDARETWQVIDEVQASAGAEVTV